MLLRWGGAGNALMQSSSFTAWAALLCSLPLAQLQTLRQARWHHSPQLQGESSGVG